MGLEMCRGMVRATCRRMSLRHTHILSTSRHSGAGAYPQLLATTQSMSTAARSAQTVLRHRTTILHSVPAARAAPMEPLHPVAMSPNVLAANRGSHAHRAPTSACWIRMGRTRTPVAMVDAGNAPRDRCGCRRSRGTGRPDAVSPSNVHPALFCRAVDAYASHVRRVRCRDMTAYAVVPAAPRIAVSVPSATIAPATIYATSTRSAWIHSCGSATRDARITPASRSLRRMPTLLRSRRCSAGSIRQ